jgi:hypothetical protein
MSIFASRAEPGQAPQVHELRNRAAGRLRSLLQDLSDTHRAAAELDNLRALFESLRLAGGEFGVAMNHLRCAQRFLGSDEVGAARYELRLLLGSLQWS